MDVASKDIVMVLCICRLVPPFQKLGDEVLGKWNRFFRSLGFDSPHPLLHDGAPDVKFSRGKVDIFPLHPAQLAPPHAGGEIEKNRNSFPLL